MDTLDLLNIAVAQGHSLEKQYQNLREDSTIQAARAVAVNAAALSLTSQTPEFAIVLLEEGRGVIFRQLAHLSAELGSIRAVNPTLAERFENLSRQLRALALTGSQKPSPRLTNIGAGDGVDDEAETPSPAIKSRRTKNMTEELMEKLDTEDESDAEGPAESPGVQSHHAAR